MSVTQDEVSTTGDQFYRLFYETVDKKRHLLPRMYLDSAVMIWNGNPMSGTQEIQKFYENLPTTQHSVMSADAQAVLDVAVGQQKTILLQIAGTVAMREYDRVVRPFTQSFIITAVGDKWKVVTDVLRYQEPPPNV